MNLMTTDKYNVTSGVVMALIKLLLIPNLDTAFDRGLITFKDDGAIKISSFLSLDAQDKLGINNSLKILKIKKENISYLEYHRKHIFQE